MPTDLSNQEFHPERLSRRGEALAWASALLVGAAWFLLKRSGQPVNLMVPILGVPLLLAALSISLGNWMDRQTVLRLDPAGVEFRNGLRHVQLGWKQIQRVSVQDSAWGKKVQVLADADHFEFRTLGELKAQGEVRGRVGFAQGDQILASLVENAGLQQVGSTEDRAVYGRE